MPGLSRANKVKTGDGIDLKHDNEKGHGIWADVIKLKSLPLHVEATITHVNLND